MKNIKQSGKTMLHTKKLPQSMGSIALVATLLPVSVSAQEVNTSAATDNLSPDRGSLRMPARDFSSSKMVIKPRSESAKSADPLFSVPEVVLEEVTKRKFSLQGLSIGQADNLDAAKMNEVMTPWLNRELTFAEFQEASQALAEHLRANGHPNAQVKISQMQFKEGQVAIAIAGLTPPVVPTEPRIAVKSIEVEGVTAVSQATIDKAIAGYVGKDLTVKELGEVTESVAAALRNEGFALAQAYLPPQKVDQGKITIAVQEGVVDGSAGKGGVTVTGAGSLVKNEVVEGYLATGVVANKPLNVNQLERGLRIVNDMPGVQNVTTNLAPGSVPGTTQVLAEVKEGKPVTASLSADNFGSPYIGEGRVHASVNVNSPSGHGEQYFVNLSKSSSMSSFKLGGHAPVGYSGLRMGASYSSMEVDVVGTAQLEALGINSDSRVASVFASYPWERSANRNTFLTASLDNKTYKNNSKSGAIGSAIDNERVINALNMGASGDLFASWGGKVGWGVNLALANNDLSANKYYRDSVDKPAANTQGNFTKLNANLNQILPLSNDWYLYTSLSAQWADKNLDSAEKFQLGGPFGVRAYPVGEGLGDHGWLATAEVRHNVGETQLGNVELFGFADTGGVTQFVSSYSTAFVGKANNKNSYNLTGVGVGVGVTYKDTGNLRLMVAEKVGTNPNPTVNNTDADGKNDSTRIWVVGTIVF